MNRNDRLRRLDHINSLREQQGVRFSDTWERDFDKNFNRFAKVGITVWVIGALLTIAFWVVVIWAIVQGVQWLQTQ